jgi:GT2 family glycosyltransferase
MDISLLYSPAPRVSIIIPASSTLDLLLACLRSLARFVPSGIPHETIVLLNESDEDAAARLRARVAGAQVVASRANLGLAGAGNYGRHLARGDLLVLLHDDAEVSPGWLEALVETADAHPEAGAIGGKVLFPDGRMQDAGMILWRDATTSAPWIGDAPSPNAFDQLRAVDYCGTSSLLVRASAWDAVGGLDERYYPVYYVDVDLGMALRRIGHIVLYQPTSVIRHHRGGSRSIRFRGFVTERNRRIFLEKWGPQLQAYEPPPEQNAPEAIDRALARAAAVAARCRETPAGDLAQAGSPFDPAAQENRHLAYARDLQRDYAAHLTDLLDQSGAELARLRADSAAERNRHSGWRSLFGRSQ